MNSQTPESAHDESKNTKERILNAAITLFAQRGYGNVGVREIVKKAGANIAMVNYYFGGKIGILREIIEACFRIRAETILKYYQKKGSVEDRTRSIIRSYVELMRNHTELALVAFRTKTDATEIVELQKRLSRESYELVKDFFEDIGLDLRDAVQGVSLGGIMQTVVLNHFHALYEWAAIEGETGACFDDRFYEQYIEILTHFYLHGVYGVVGELRKSAKKTAKGRLSRKNQ